MLQINLGNFGNFSLLGKVINVDLFHFCPKKLGTLKNLSVLKCFLAFWGILIMLKNKMLKIVFMYAQKLWAL
jgi:hypothetical protein